jgi:phage replication-related protein YjqB (UPF0714/DUF867 family)
MDRYRSFCELVKHHPEGRDFVIEVDEVNGSPLLVVAPHGGLIEPGTSQMARSIAGKEFSYYAFVGARRSGNSALHITSHHFDEPRCLDLLSRHDYVIAVHGCKGTGTVFVGGLDSKLGSFLNVSLSEAGFVSKLGGHRFPGVEPKNICNRGRRDKGVQIELTADLRQGGEAARLASAVRDAMQKFLPHD